MQKKIAIKVIKRKDIAEKIRVAAKTIKVLAKTNHNVVEAVNGWIFELKEHKDKEKVFSSNKISSWELVPNTIEKAKG